ncbi:type VII secretion system-associated protein [Nocardia fusca]|uniref:type VII secretion system-associated protein n=1 Tax=Nocardia fusca TaxID=941183 RepID=UPI0007A74204|nr:type VII secretion system-associated protein [Nocardia fusca]
MDPEFRTIRRGDWLVLLDPRWTADAPDVHPPATAIMGGWGLDESGVAAPFDPNPDYRPSDAASPTDPIDTVLRRAVAGDDVTDRIVPTIRDSMVHLGCDEAGQPLVGPAPDSVLCAPVVTAEVHKQRVGPVHWRKVWGGALADIVPPEVDILVNPGGPAQFRLINRALRAAE